MTAAAEFLSVSDTSVPHPGMASSRARSMAGATRRRLPVVILLTVCCLLTGCKEWTRRTAQNRLAAEGGISFLIRVQPAAGREVNTDSVALAAAIIEKRLNPAGNRDVAVTAQGTDGLYVEVPGMKEEEIAKAKETIQKVARLEFRLLGPDGYATTTAEDETIKPGYVKLRYLNDHTDDKEPGAEKEKQKPNKFLWVKNKAELSGKSVKYAGPALSPGALNCHIDVELHPDFGEKMLKISTANNGKPVAIVLEDTPGEFEVVSAPTIVSPFGSNFQITGNFTEAEARELASQMMNPLENPLRVEKTTTIPPASAKKP